MIFDQMMAKVVFDWWVALGSVLFFAVLLSLCTWFCGKRSDFSDCYDDGWNAATYASGAISGLLWVGFIVHACTFSTILYPGAAVLFRFAR
jgi:hypothetical protein